jgi:hypothetical protein
VYLGYVMVGGELKIDPTKMEAMIKWIYPINFIELGVFLGQHNTFRSS